jgi:hypothetical protein
VNDRNELVDGVAPEYGIVRVHEIDNIKSYDFCSHRGVLPEGHIDINLA